MDPQELEDLRPGRPSNFDARGQPLEGTPVAHRRTVCPTALASAQSESCLLDTRSESNVAIDGEDRGALPTPPASSKLIDKPGQGIAASPTQTSTQLDQQLHSKVSRVIKRTSSSERSSPKPVTSQTSFGWVQRDVADSSCVDAVKLHDSGGGDEVKSTALLLDATCPPDREELVTATKARMTTGFELAQPSRKQSGGHLHVKGHDVDAGSTKRRSSVGLAPQRDKSAMSPAKLSSSIPYPSPTVKTTPEHHATLLHSFSSILSTLWGKVWKAAPKEIPRSNIEVRDAGTIEEEREERNHWRTSAVPKKEKWTLVGVHNGARTTEKCDRAASVRDEQAPEDVPKRDEAIRNLKLIDTGSVVPSGNLRKDVSLTSTSSPQGHGDTRRPRRPRSRLLLDSAQEAKTIARQRYMVGVITAAGESPKPHESKKRDKSGKKKHHKHDLEHAGNAEPDKPQAHGKRKHRKKRRHHKRDEHKHKESASRSRDGRRKHEGEETVKNTKLAETQGQPAESTYDVSGGPQREFNFSIGMTPYTRGALPRPELTRQTGTHPSPYTSQARKKPVRSRGEDNLETLPFQPTLALRKSQLKSKEQGQRSNAVASPLSVSPQRREPSAHGEDVVPSIKEVKSAKKGRLDAETVGEPLAKKESSPPAEAQGLLSPDGSPKPHRSKSKQKSKSTRRHRSSHKSKSESRSEHRHRRAKKSHREHHESSSIGHRRHGEHHKSISSGHKRHRAHHKSSSRGHRRHRGHHKSSSRGHRRHGKHHTGSSRGHRRHGKHHKSSSRDHRGNGMHDRKKKYTPEDAPESTGSWPQGFRWCTKDIPSVSGTYQEISWSTMRLQSSERSRDDGSGKMKRWEYKIPFSSLSEPTLLEQGKVPSVKRGVREDMQPDLSTTSPSGGSSEIPRHYRYIEMRGRRSTSSRDEQKSRSSSRSRRSGRSEHDGRHGHHRRGKHRHHHRRHESRRDHESRKSRRSGSHRSHHSHRSRHRGRRERERRKRHGHHRHHRSRRRHGEGSPRSPQSPRGVASPISPLGTMRPPGPQRVLSPGGVASPASPSGMMSPQSPRGILSPRGVASPTSRSGMMSPGSPGSLKSPRGFASPTSQHGITSPAALSSASSPSSVTSPSLTSPSGLTSPLTSTISGRDQRDERRRARRRKARGPRSRDGRSRKSRKRRSKRRKSKHRRPDGESRSPRTSETLSGSRRSRSGSKRKSRRSKSRRSGRSRRSRRSKRSHRSRSRSRSRRRHREKSWEHDESPDSRTFNEIILGSLSPSRYSEKRSRKRSESRRRERESRKRRKRRHRSGHKRRSRGRRSRASRSRHGSRHRVKRGHEIVETTSAQLTESPDKERSQASSPVISTESVSREKQREITPTRQYEIMGSREPSSGHGRRSKRRSKSRSSKRSRHKHSKRSGSRRRRRRKRKRSRRSRGRKSRRSSRRSRSRRSPRRRRSSRRRRRTRDSPRRRRHGKRRERYRTLASMRSRSGGTVLIVTKSEEQFAEDYAGESTTPVFWFLLLTTICATLVVILCVSVIYYALIIRPKPIPPVETVPLPTFTDYTFTRPSPDVTTEETTPWFSRKTTLRPVFTTRMDPYYCTSDYCNQEARYISSVLSRRTDACQDFYDYVCGTWTNEHQAHAMNTGSLISRDTMLQEALTRHLLEQLSGHDEKDVEMAVELQRTCVNWITNYPPAASNLRILFAQWTIVEWPRNDPVHDGLKAVWRFAAELFRDLDLPTIAQVSVSLRPDNLDATVLELDVPRFLLGEAKGWAASVAELFKQAVNEIVSEMEASVKNDFEERLFTVCSGFGALRRSSYSDDRAFIIVRFEDLSDGLREFVRVLLANVPQQLPVQTSVVLRSAPYFYGDLDVFLRSVPPEDTLNYLGFLVIVRLAPFLSRKMHGLQNLFVESVMGRTIGDTEDRSLLCGWLVNRALPECMAKVARQWRRSTDQDVATREWLSQLEAVFVRHVADFRWIDELSALLVRYRLKQQAATQLGLASGKQRLCAVELERSQHNPLMFYWNLSRHRQEDVFLGLLRNSMALRRWNSAGSELSTEASFRRAFQMIHVPAALFNDSVPIKGSVFVFHLARVAVRFYRAFVQLLYENPYERDAPLSFSEEARGKLADLLACFQRVAQNINSEEASSLGRMFLDLTSALHLAVTAFDELLPIRRIWKLDLRLNDLPEVTAHQLFFIYFALDNCESVDREFHEARLSAKYRVNVPLSHYRQFAEAFRCGPLSPMSAVGPYSCAVSYPERRRRSGSEASRRSAVNLGRGRKANAATSPWPGDRPPPD